MTTTKRQDVSSRPARLRRALASVDAALAGTPFVRRGRVLVLCVPGVTKFSWPSRMSRERMPTRLPAGGLMTGRIAVCGSVPVVALVLRERPPSSPAHPLLDTVTRETRRLIDGLGRAGVPLLVHTVSAAEVEHDTTGINPIEMISERLEHVPDPGRIEFGAEFVRVLSGGCGELYGHDFFGDAYDVLWQLHGVEQRPTLTARRASLLPEQERELRRDAAGDAARGAVAFHRLGYPEETPRDLGLAWEYCSTRREWFAAGA
ncbi:hypothetical protein [Deinococcus yunweiensis]|uniref:hypothetical protein n=1 Tax=Deinococcus yunweiensis TaxID=367282 RepID=UPI00398ECC58